MMELRKKSDLKNQRIKLKNFFAAQVGNEKFIFQKIQIETMEREISIIDDKQ